MYYIPLFPNRIQNVWTMDKHSSEGIRARDRVIFVIKYFIYII